ncbi:ABC transporter permease subunit [candidate division KSB3 bacterium]|uniref:ABC transporter permease subunit n=1 Tax=candidate division KSB3 bacterium TaxID=2044937 RepID=A0A9D5JRR1_9BACT|nr:ABC transporter permease subunit [candidate division KSB3 bacterium]MBD3323045.1 ABC transporter permease subunit [candidate division KSB3 bacterium]
MMDKILESKILAYAIVIGLLALMMLPIYWTLVTAFKPDAETYVFPPVYLPSNPTVEPFKLLFEDYSFDRYLRNSLIVTIVTTLVVTVTGMFAAYGISQYPFKGGTTVLYVLLFTRVIPPLSLLLPFYIVVSKLRLVDNLLSMIIANIYLTYPFAVLIMKSFFDSFPSDLIDAGIIDGCSRSGVLFRIVLPVSATGIASSAIITYLWTWNEFIYAFVFTSTPSSQPVTVGCFDAIGDIFVNWNQMCAGATLAALPGIIFVLIAQRYLVQGLTAGALKF